MATPAIVILDDGLTLLHDPAGHILISQFRALNIDIHQPHDGRYQRLHFRGSEIEIGHAQLFVVGTDLIPIKDARVGHLGLEPIVIAVAYLVHGAKVQVMHRLATLEGQRGSNGFGILEPRNVVAAKATVVQDAPPPDQLQPLLKRHGRHHIEGHLFGILLGKPAEGNGGQFVLIQYGHSGVLEFEVAHGEQVSRDIAGLPIRQPEIRHATDGIVNGGVLQPVEQPSGGNLGTQTDEVGTLALGHAIEGCLHNDRLSLHHMAPQASNRGHQRFSAPHIACAARAVEPGGAGLLEEIGNHGVNLGLRSAD